MHRVYKSVSRRLVALCERAEKLGSARLDADQRVKDRHRCVGRGLRSTLRCIEGFWAGLGTVAKRGRLRRTELHCQQDKSDSG